MRLAFGAAAPQTGNGGPGSEDCLFLNVATPALRDGARRPILVYIHGGGYNNGSGSDPITTARACAGAAMSSWSRSTTGSTPSATCISALLGDDAFAHSGNVGQLDLVAALHWVRQHALEFGGDPGNVTVFGQSGGGAKIATLMAMPAARGLFHRAWTMSGQQVTAAGPRAADAARAAVPRRVEDRTRGHRRACVRCPMQALLDATRTRDPSRVEDTGLYFGPVMDGRDLPRHPFHPDAPRSRRAFRW